MANTIDTDAKIIVADQWGFGQPTLCRCPSAQFDINETKLLLHLNGTDGDTSTSDASLSNHTVAFYGDAQLDDAQKKYGTTSLLLDGVGDYLRLNDSPNWDMKGIYFAIDLWIKHNDHTGNEVYIAQYQDVNNWWRLYHVDGAGLRFYVYQSGGSYIDTGFSSEITDTDWHHLALIKVGNEWGIYLDGNQVDYINTSNTIDFTGSLYIGQDGGGSNYFAGHEDEIRICHSNIFNAAPNNLNTDTITVPTSEHSLDLTTTSMLFAAHINDSSQLEIHRSIDDGVNWSLVKTFTETDPADFEMATIDSTSAAIVFMYTGNDYKVYVTDDNGVTWTQKQYINGTACIKAHLVYDSVENRLYLSSREGTTTYIAYSTDKGDNWTNTYHVTGASSEHISDMDVSPYNSDVYLTMIQSGGSPGNKVYKYDKNGNYITNVGLSGNYNNDGCIVIDSSGNYMVIEGYRYSDGGYKFSLGASYNGASFTNLIPGLATRPWITGSVSVAVDGDDNFYAFYTKVSDEKTYYRKWTGSSWESEVILVGVANDRISCEKRPISGSNKLHFVYYKAP